MKVRRGVVGHPDEPGEREGELREGEVEIGVEAEAGVGEEGQREAEGYAMFLLCLFGRGSRTSPDTSGTTGIGRTSLDQHGLRPPEPIGSIFLVE